MTENSINVPLLCFISQQSKDGKVLMDLMDSFVFSLAFLDFSSGKSQEEERVHGHSGEEVSLPPLLHSFVTAEKLGSNM